MADKAGLWDAIYGNDHLKQTIITDIRRKRLSHAYIIEGPEESGKLTFARTMAAYMADTAANIRKIMSGISPDIIEVSLSDDRKTIGVDAVRGLRLKAYIKPNDLDYKFIIINNAEALTKAAMNALLKLVEEPPSSVYVLFLCVNTSSLLPTIRSRAPVLRMQIFSQEELAELLLSHSEEAREMDFKDHSAFITAIRSSNGTYGDALSKVSESNKRHGDVNYIIVDIIEAVCERNTEKLNIKINSLPPVRTDFFDSVFAIRTLVRDIMAYRVTYGECDFLFPVTEKTKDFSKKLSLDKLLSINDILSEAERMYLYNPNVLTIKSYLFTKFNTL